MESLRATGLGLGPPSLGIPWSTEKLDKMRQPDRICIGTAGGRGMEWARIMAPLSGGEGDRKVADAARLIAEPFESELALVHAPADVADLIPWMGDGFMGGVQATAVESIRLAAREGEAAARAVFDDCDYTRKTFIALKSPVWAGMAMEGRLSDVLVFDDAAARGKGSLAEAFQQIVASEQRPTIVARSGLKVGGVVAVAWDGGKEASRAMRTALPLLRRAASVVILTAQTNSSRKCEPDRLRAFLAAREIASEVEKVTCTGETAASLLAAAEAASANILVCGAFGHPRLREFIFGGATRTFFNADSPSLFISH